MTNAFIYTLSISIGILHNDPFGFSSPPFTKMFGYNYLIDSPLSQEKYLEELGMIGHFSYSNGYPENMIDPLIKKRSIAKIKNKDRIEELSHRRIYISLRERV